jgi:Protein of unknown function (DUF3048) N-terminal domain/Protein of unknown function (DUF3048) C-terminal domain
LAVRMTTALVVGALVATAIGGCSSDPEQKAASDKPTLTPTPTPTSQAPKAAVTNPLTGVGAPPDGPVIAVKVDDTPPGLPSLGLEKADVIYIEEVEGGLSRMVAVFASAKPKVRAVRSIRPSDPELLGQYGRIIVIASGGGRKALQILDKSTLHSVVNDRGQVGFFRDQSRPAPYNVVSDLAVVSASIKADGVRNVGFAWAAKDPRLTRAKPAATVSTRVGSTPVGFVWDRKLASYVRTVAGRRVLTGSGAPVAKPNVLVQFCRIIADPTDRDVNGNPTMFTNTVGTGRVVLFRDGKRILGTWSRPRIGDPTTFKDAAGKSLLFAPGGTFVALARPGAPA